MITIGIDPGISLAAPGGIGIITNKGARGFTCPKETLGIYKLLLPYKGIATVAIEELGLRHSDLLIEGKAFNIIKMLRHHQRCLDVCEILEIPITSIAPMRWKTHYGLIGTGVSECVSKSVECFESAIDDIYQRSPGGRKIVPYSGIAAALLMAGWLRDQTAESLQSLNDKRIASQAKAKAKNNAKTAARKAERKAVLA